VVLLNIWATWCAPCREEIPYLQELYEKYSQRGLEVVGVSVDAAGEDEQIKAFLGEMRASYPIWRDPEQRVMSLFLSLGVPASYLLDRNGILRWKHLGVLRPENKEFSAALEAALAEGAAR
jgi:thiol-disulfide isomerase/thioredoxin